VASFWVLAHYSEKSVAFLPVFALASFVNCRNASEEQIGCLLRDVAQDLV